MKAFLLALVVVPLAACLEPPPDATPDAGTGTTTEEIGTSIQCSHVCADTDSCDKPCLDDTSGYGTSCGKFGKCESCDASCTAGSTCEHHCLVNGLLSDCYGAGDACNECSPDVCDAQGCGAYCEQPIVAQGLLPFPKVGYRRCDSITTPLGDKDSDGMPDTLEDALARRFLPNIYLNGDYHQNDEQFYGTGYAGDPLARVPYVVRKVPALKGSRAGWCAQGQCAEIIYGFPYNWDTGSLGGLGEHRGDSEHIAILVAYKRADDETNGGAWGTTWTVAQNDATVWRQVAIFYGAHTCDNTDNTNWDSSEFVWPYNNGTYSQTGLKNDYVSGDKHANYETQSDCDWGAYGFDDCYMPHLVRASVLARLFNAGDQFGGTYYQAGLACVGFDHTIATPGAAESTPPTDSPPYDLWSIQSFGAPHAQPFSLWMSRGSIDWGNQTYACPPGS